jgi:hypothetical protein
MEKTSGQSNQQSLQSFLDLQKHVWKKTATETKAVYWIYTTVVRPIVTYAARVWWPRVEYKTSKAELSILQRMASLGITGVMRTTPTTAIKVLLGLPPLHLQLEVEAKEGIYRLGCKDQWKPRSEASGHARMTWNIKREPILWMRTDKMIPRYILTCEW